MTAGLSQRRERLVGRLRTARARAREGAVLVEGVRAASEALACGIDVAFAVVSPRLTGTERGEALREALEGRDVVTVDDAVVEGLSDTARPQGVLLVCAEPRRSLADVSSGGRFLVLDGVQDPGNAGTLVRSARAFGIDGVLCLDGTVDPWSPKAVRASAGAVFGLPVVRSGTGDALERLATIAVPLWAADAVGEPMARLRGARPLALAVGNEGRGVRPEVLAASARSVAVPMPGGTESLNVAMAGSILLHELTREDAT